MLTDVAAAIRDIRGASPSVRVRVVVASAVQAKLLERGLAVHAAGPLSPSGAGVAGVEVVRLIDLADHLATVLGDEPVRAATLREVAELAVRPALVAATVPDGGWLDLSRDHPASWYRLARAISRASLLCRSRAEPLPAPEIVIAADVEQRLLAHGLVLPGRLVLRAVDLVRDHPAASTRRAVGQVIWVDPASGTPVDGCAGELRAALVDAGVVTTVVPATTSSSATGARRAMVLPDAQGEARVVADQVRQWLLADVPYDDIVVITPEDAGYQGIVRAALEDWGIPAWTSLPHHLLSATPAGVLAAALGRALDSTPGCALCGVVQGHECNGQYADVSVVVSQVLPFGLARPILDAARKLTLTSGLGHWRSLLTWLAGDDDALPGVTARNAQATQARVLVPRAPRDPYASADLASAAAALASILGPVDVPSSALLRERLRALGQLAEASGRGRITGLDSVLSALAEDEHPAPDCAALVAPALARPWGTVTKPGDGVAVVSVSDLAAVDAPYVAWCGLVEGLCPPAPAPDPLVAGDLEMVRAAQLAVDADAARVQLGARSLLATAPRVRLGTRAVEVGSRWLVHWTGLTIVGAAELVEASQDTAARWAPAEGWTIDVADSSLDVLAGHPSPADVLIPGSDQAELAADAASSLVARLAAWADPRPSVDDGVLGPLDDADHWLADKVAAGWTLSPSRAQYWGECPRRFFYGTVLGLRASDDDPDPGNPVPRNVWGDLVHAALEECFPSLVAVDDRDQQLALLIDAIRGQFAAYLPFVDPGDPGLAHDIQRQARAIRDVIPPDAWERGMPEFEVSINGEIAGLPTAGFVDVLWPDHVVDLKTGKLDRTKYLPQVGMYAQMQHDSTGEPVSSAIWFVKDDTSHRPGVVPGPTVPSADGSAAAHLALMAALRSGVEQGVFPAVGDPVGDSEPCTYCDFTSVCDPGTGDRWQVISGSPLVAPALVVSAPGSAAADGANDGGEPA